jgi:hypothetical protein
MVHGDELNLGCRREGSIRNDSQMSGVSDWMNVDTTCPDKKQRRRRAVSFCKMFALFCFAFVKGVPGKTVSLVWVY